MCGWVKCVRTADAAALATARAFELDAVDEPGRGLGGEEVGGGSSVEAGWGGWGEVRMSFKSVDGCKQAGHQRGEWPALDLFPRYIIRQRTLRPLQKGLLRAHSYGWVW